MSCHSFVLTGILFTCFERNCFFLQIPPSTQQLSNCAPHVLKFLRRTKWKKTTCFCGWSSVSILKYGWFAAHLDASRCGLIVRISYSSYENALKKHSKYAFKCVKGLKVDLWFDVSLADKIHVKWPLRKKTKKTTRLKCKTAGHQL